MFFFNDNYVDNDSIKNEANGNDNIINNVFIDKYRLNANRTWKMLKKH